MDSQRRIVLSKDFRDLTSINYEEPLALCLEDDKLFYLQNANCLEPETTVVGVVRVDSKGRFFFPKTVLNHYKIELSAQEFVFVQGKYIYISFL